MLIRYLKKLNSVILSAAVAVFATTSAFASPVYVVGDSHGVAIKNAGGFFGMPVGGATTKRIATQVNDVPNGSVVVLSSGNNDFYQKPSHVVQMVQNVIDDLKNKDCYVIFVVFPSIDLNGEYADTYSKANYNLNYNQVRQALLNVKADHILELTTGDINPKDNMKIHATFNAYKRIADSVKTHQ